MMIDMRLSNFKVGESSRLRPVVVKLTVDEDFQRFAIDTERVLIPDDDIRVFAMDRTAFEQLVEDGDVAALKFGMALSRVLASRVVDLNSKLVALARERGESVPESSDPVGLSEDFMGWWDTYS